MTTSSTESGQPAHRESLTRDDALAQAAAAYAAARERLTLLSGAA